MYNLPYFKDADTNTVIAFMEAHPFALLCGSNRSGAPAATQIPVFLVEKAGHLHIQGHIMRGSDHYHAFAENPQVLCVFTGAHSYVSATWYTEANQASTWNYMSVHARGTLNFGDEHLLESLLQKTSLHYEGGRQDSPTVFENLPVDYRTKLMKAIVAIDIKVEKLDHVFKLSQNRDEKSYEQIMDHLQSGDANAQGVAQEMCQRRKYLFNQDGKGRPSQA